MTAAQVQCTQQWFVLLCAACVTGDPCYRRIVGGQPCACQRGTILGRCLHRLPLHGTTAVIAKYVPPLNRNPYLQARTDLQHNVCTAKLRRLKPIATTSGSMACGRHKSNCLAQCLAIASVCAINNSVWLCDSEKTLNYICLDCTPCQVKSVRRVSQVCQGATCSTTQLTHNLSAGTLAA